MVQPQPPPELNIPYSKHTVNVSIIVVSTIAGLPVDMFMNPAIPGYTTMSAPSYSFSIRRNNAGTSGKYDHIIFDLGVRKDFENSPKSLLENAKAWTIHADKNVDDILREHGDDPSGVGAIIWSHHHFDHTGDPSTFPPTTDLIVGPEFKSRCVPAYPTKPESSLDEKAWANRELVEIDFEDKTKALQIGPYRAYDFHGDGSFYLLDTPGHTLPHLCGLARTAADPPEFVLMGGDIAHHGGQLRPTIWQPLPDDIQPNPLEKPFTLHAPICPGAVFEAIHPQRSSTEPYMWPTGFVHEDVELGVQSLKHFHAFDAQDNVLAVIAHDASLLEVLESYPKLMNGWMGKGWKQQGRWRFLRDFDTSGVQGEGPK